MFVCLIIFAISPSILLVAFFICYDFMHGVMSFQAGVVQFAMNRIIL